MALSFPLPWSSFAARLPIQSAAWKLRRFEEVSWDGASVPSVAEQADPRWTCKVVLDVMLRDDAVEFQTLIDLHGSSRPLLLHDPMRPAPRADLDGLLLGAASPVLGSVSASGFSLVGLPPFYEVSVGDLISAAHGLGQRVALYAAAQAVVANAGGSTPEIPVLPAPRPSAAPGDAVTLKNPVGLMIILPETFDPGRTSGAVTRDMSFQTVEAW